MNMEPDCSEIGKPHRARGLAVLVHGRDGRASRHVTADCRRHSCHHPPLQRTHAALRELQKSIGAALSGLVWWLRRLLLESDDGVQSPEPTVDRENQPLKVVLWPPHMDCSMWPHPTINTTFLKSKGVRGFPTLGSQVIGDLSERLQMRN